ncbi:von Willebrand factor C domain-containing protein 2-like [Mactra antiquata]
MRCFVIISALIGVTLCNTKPPMIAATCTYNGITYHSGESFQPSPCEHCYCPPGGHVACAIADCFFTPCVDAVHDPTKCCPQCPNGPNCRHTDGTIIKQGDVYHPDANTECRCADNHFGFGTDAALCAIKMTVQPQTVQVVS